ncbi:protein of unknown function (plasmid) [Cupriavidus taiwanensis]|uniref:Uncharacterized protein n=1 Tax=Cupriavidus taiwanensis TaxID=164546 RepID=A0A375IWV6_9BURK|nr:protein of unknown function [Cupriavidus taiwanensis]
MIPKHERRFTGFDQRIMAMYARGSVCPHRKRAPLGQHDNYELAVAARPGVFCMASDLLRHGANRI